MGARIAEDFLGGARRVRVRRQTSLPRMIRAPEASITTHRHPPPQSPRAPGAADPQGLSRQCAPHPSQRHAAGGGEKNESGAEGRDRREKRGRKGLRGDAPARRKSEGVAARLDFAHALGAGALRLAVLLGRLLEPRGVSRGPSLSVLLKHENQVSGPQGDQYGATREYAEPADGARHIQKARLQKGRRLRARDRQGDVTDLRRNRRSRWRSRRSCCCALICRQQAAPYAMRPA